MKWRIAFIIQAALCLFLFAVPMGLATGDPSALVTGGPTLWKDSFPPSIFASNSKLRFADIDADANHRADAVLILPGLSCSALSNGASFSGLNCSNNNYTTNSEVSLADANGDHRADVVSNEGGTWKVAISSGYDGFATPTVWNTGFGATAGSISRVGDITGDGKADLAGYSSGSWKVGIAFGTSFFQFSGWPIGAVPPVFGTVQESFLADVNNDGKDDAIGVVGGAWHVALSTGLSWASDQTWLTGFDAQPPSQAMLADVNGDGRDDAVVYSSGAWKVATSTGTGFSAPVVWGKGFSPPVNSTSTSRAFAADANGDGNVDPVVESGGNVYVSTSLSIPEQIKSSGSGWQAILSEDFDGPVLDSNVWNLHRYDYWLTGATAGSPVLKSYSDKEDFDGPDSQYVPGNSTIVDGKLVQKLVPPGVNGNSSTNYTVGSVNTLGRIQSDGSYVPSTGRRFKRGYVEARVKVPGCVGCWPALWMLPAPPNSPVPAQVPLCWGYPEELDIFEFDPRETSNHYQSFNSHWNTTPPTSCPPPPSYSVNNFDNQAVRKQVVDADLTGAFNTYGFLWTSGYIQFFVNGIAGQKITMGVPQKDMYLISTLQHWASIPTVNEAQMETDYIRVYQ